MTHRGRRIRLSTQALRHSVKDRAMTTTDHTASLHSIDRDALMTTDPAADVRDRRVLDKAGQDIGHVDDLLVDDREHKVRFLRVAAGGFLGLGEAKFLIPVDAITKVEAKAVHVDQTLDLGDGRISVGG
jgi:sporulation protein YlmC with PRC-barrel domain